MRISKKIIFEKYKIDVDKIEKSGAAGGIAGGMRASLNAPLVSGFDFFKKITRIENLIKKADLIVTGEGRIDKTTFYGKATGNIISICKKFKKPLVLIAGDYKLNKKILMHYGVVGIYSLKNIAGSENSAMRNSKSLLLRVGEEIAENLRKNMS